MMSVQWCARARQQQHAIGLVLSAVSCCYLLLIVFKRSFHKRLGIARDIQYPYTQAEAECVEIYSYSDDGDRLADGIQETLMRLQYVGIWF